MRSLRAIHGGPSGVDAPDRPLHPQRLLHDLQQQEIAALEAHRELTEWCSSKLWRALAGLVFYRSKRGELKHAAELATARVHAAERMRTACQWHAVRTGR